jgi:hypothetical protein
MLWFVSKKQVTAEGDRRAFSMVNVWYLQHNAETQQIVVYNPNQSVLDDLTITITDRNNASAKICLNELGAGIAMPVSLRLPEIKSVMHPDDLTGISIETMGTSIFFIRSGNMFVQKSDLDKDGNEIFFN